MATMLDDSSQRIASWLKSTTFSQGYVFGSLVHKSGSQFDPQLSDVDVICRFQPNDTYFTRWTAVNNAKNTVLDLNLDFLKLFKRNDASKPIVSLVPVSSFELAYGLHKDGALQFFSHNKFHCVQSRSTGPIGKEHKQESPQIEGALDSIREAQRVRNKILSIAPNGNSTFGDYDGPDVLPKDFARCAAQVRWAHENPTNPDQRFDVNEGLVYALQLLTARRNEANEVDDLMQRTVVRMGGRGNALPLSASDQSLLWEILADEASGLIPPETQVKLPSTRRSESTRISSSTKKQAFIRAGFRCTFPGCGVPLGENGIGEIAFIASPNLRGPRHDPSLKRADATALDNLIVLCPTHHRLVDASPDKYSVKAMKSWNEQAKAAPHHPVFNSNNLFTIIRLILEILK